MQKGKKQRGKQPQRAKVAAPRNLLVQAFKGDQVVAFRNGPGPGEITLEGPFQLDADSKFRWEEFDRLVIPSLSATASASIVFDVIPDNRARIDFVVDDKKKKKKSDLIVEARVRSTVVNDGHVILRLTLVKEKGKLTYTEFSLRGASSFNVPTGDPNQPGTIRLKLAQSTTATTDPVTEVITHTEEAPYTVPLLPNGFESKFGKGLDIEFGRPTAAGNQIKIFFERVFEPPQGQAGDRIFGIGFSAARLDDDDDETRFLRLFSAVGVCSTNGHVGFSVPTQVEGVRQEWEIKQRPFRDLRAQSKSGTPTRWHVSLGNIPAASFYDPWNCLVEEYWRALNTVRGGNPVSFLPKFEENENDDGRWEIAYVISDATRLEDPEYEFQTTNPATRISIQGRTIGPAQPYNPKLSLGQVRNHHGAALLLRGSIARAPLDDVLPIEPTITVSFSGPLTYAGATDPEQQTSRVGALDVKIASQIDPSGGTDPASAKYTINLPGPNRKTLGITVLADIGVEKVRPGGQDDLPSEEFVAENAGTIVPVDEAERPCDVLGISDPYHRDFGANLHSAINNRKAKPDFNQCVESGFRRKRPIIIGLGEEETIARDRMFLKVDETAREAATQTLDLQLLNQTAADNSAPALQSSVIVLDHNPFLVAQVRYTPFTRQVVRVGATIAQWTNRTGEGASWQIVQNADRQGGEREGPADIILPSQGIGEEMERGYPGKELDPSGNPTGRGFTIPPGQLADFRLAPPARLSVKVAEAAQNFIEAPWNLRRLLGFPQQRTPGVRVSHFQVELLYGLSCDAQTPFLRLAEITALAGAVPARLHIEPLWAPQVATGGLSIGEEYQRRRFEWSRLYHRYLSRLAILEPWDTHVRESLILSEGVICRIRKVQDRTPPLPDGIEAELADPVADNPGPGLKGGATWGFESKNIYNAVMRPGGPAQFPTSTSASIADLYFSSLGGWGRLSAGFDKDRSKIYDDVALGRTYSYKLERIGRIACWWNRAKHVIVYERTVRRSRQFETKQVGHEGRPIVRKVREYIKILDEKRTYPDSETELSQTERQVLEKRRGFVAACSFQPGDEIAVDGSWGTDVGDIGWKIPLWNPAADPVVYPRPNITAHLYSDVGGVSQPSPCRLAEPQSVYFYTDTRADTSGDPNEWPPVKGVDYVDCPLPRPQVDFDDGNPRQTTPNDLDVPAGFGPCTFRLEPPPVPADLVAARAGKPLSAALETVTILRALLTDRPPASNNVLVQAVNTALGLGGGLKDPIRGLIAPITDDARMNADAIAGLERRINNSFNNATGEFNRFFETIRGACTSLNSEINRVGDLVRQRERELFATFEKQVLEIADKRRQAFLQEIDNVLAVPAATANELQVRRERLLRAIDQHLGELQNALLLLRLSPGILQKAVSRAAVAARLLVTDSANRVRDILRRINDFSVTLTADELRELQGLTTALINEVDRLFAGLSARAAQSLESWLPNPILGIVNSDLRTRLAQWKQQLTDTILVLDASTAQLARETARQALQIEGSWIERLTQTVTQAETNATNAVERWHDRLIGGGTAAPDTSYIETQITALRVYINDAASSPDFRLLKDLVNNMLDAPLTATGITTENLRRRLTELNTLVQTQLANLITYVTDAATELCNKVHPLTALGPLRDRVIEAVNAFKNGTGREISNQIRRVLDEFNADLNEYADAAVGLFQKNPAWPQGNDVYAAANTAMAIVRAFGRPPVVPNLQFERPVLAYFYRELQDRVDTTPVLSAVAKASAVADALKPLGISLPTQALVEKLIPPDLRNFDLSKILPDFAGLNLKHLFPGLKMPSASNDRVKISHGADPQTRRAWIDVTVDFPVDKPATIFSIGPVTIRLVNARFTAAARVEAGLGGEPPRRSARGMILADWELTIGGQTIVIFRKTEVRFDESGGLRFGLDPRNLEMPGILSFLQDFMKKFAGSDSGLSIGFVAGGVQALLNLPIPDVQVGAFGITNLRVGVLLRLTVIGNGGFTITVGFNIGRKLAPFALTIFILGGGGFLEVEATYTPANRQIVCTVEMGITACASLAIALGPIKGGVFVYFGITAQFRSGAGGGLTIGVMFLIRGEVSILGIVEACVSLLLEAKYSSGRLIGHGNLSIKIKICWCFTLEISEDVTYELSVGGGGSAQLRNPELRGLVAFNDRRGGPSADVDDGVVTDVDYALPFPAPDFATYLATTTRYIDLLA